MTGAPRPLISQRTAVWLWLASAIFIIYGTTLPFHFVTGRDEIAAHLAGVRWNPLLQARTSHRIRIPDFTQNLLLFAPFGLFGAIARGRTRRVAVVVAAAALSASVETLQLFTVDRVSSFADVMADTVGALVGMLAAPAFVALTSDARARAEARGWPRQSIVWTLLATVALIAAGTWQPFDFTLDVGSIWSKVKLLRVDAWQSGARADQPLHALRFLAAGAIATTWLRREHVRHAAWIAGAALAVLAATLAASQMIVESRIPGLGDLIAIVIGIIVGVLLSPLLERLRGVTLVATVCAATIAAALPFYLAPVSPPDPNRAGGIFDPSYYLATTAAAGHAIELLLIYAPIGYAIRSQWRERRWMPVLAAAAIALPLELLQRLGDDAWPDPRNVLWTVIGAAGGAWVARRVADICLPRER